MPPGQFNSNTVCARLELKSEAHSPAGLAGGRPREYMHLVTEPLPAKPGKLLSVGAAVGGSHAHGAKQVAGLVLERLLQIDGCDAERVGV